MTAARNFAAQPCELAVRVEVDCPDCGSALVARRRHNDGHKFIACSAYPSCRYTVEYDAILSSLAADNLSLRAELAELRNGPAIDWSRELRQLIAASHPDKWATATSPTDVATEITARLVALRERL